MKSILVKTLLICLLFLGGLLVPQAAMGAPPDAPSNLIAVAGDATSIALAWQDNSDDEDGFLIFRRAEGEAAFVVIGRQSANRAFYGPSGLRPNTKYYFKVRAFKGDEYSDFSNQASDTTEEAVVRVTSPAGGEEWAWNETRNITWTSNGEGFQAQIRYRYDDSEWIQIATVPNTNSYSWTVPNVNSSRVRVAVRLLLGDELVCVGQGGEFTIRGMSSLLVVPLALLPAPPTALSASALSSSEVYLQWTDASETEAGFRIERRTSGDFTEIATVESNVTSYTDTCEPETTYTYRVRAFNDAGNSAYSNEDQVTTQAATTAPDTTAPDTTAPDTTTGRTVLRFYIDSTEYYVQGPSDTSSRLQTMDTAPIISESRTLLPIRYVSEPLGAAVYWDDALDQVTVHLGNRTIVLWINNGTARVNGVETAIDPANPAVTPIIVPPGRTMLPLRFIAENLGCEVSWNPATREVTVIYPEE